jgi:hypothetical protein
MDGWEDVRWHEKHIWRVLCHLPRESEMCPHAREWHDSQFTAAEQGGRGSITEVEAETMEALTREKRLDEAP